MSRCTLLFALLLPACGSSSHLTINEALCDGGTMTYTVPSSGDGGTVAVQQQCGSPATTTILSAPCVIAEDGGAPVATFTLPADFDPAKGDAVSASVCASMCRDAGQVCQDIPAGTIVDIGVTGGLAEPNGSVSIGCSLTWGCPGSEAYLRVTE